MILCIYCCTFFSFFFLVDRFEFLLLLLLLPVFVHFLGEKSIDVAFSVKCRLDKMKIFEIEMKMSGGQLIGKKTRREQTFARKLLQLIRVM